MPPRRPRRSRDHRNHNVNLPQDNRSLSPTKISVEQQENCGLKVWKGHRKNVEEYGILLRTTLYPNSGLSWQLAVRISFGLRILRIFSWSHRRCAFLLWRCSWRRASSGRTWCDRRCCKSPRRSRRARSKTTAQSAHRLASADRAELVDRSAINSAKLFGWITGGFLLMLFSVLLTVRFFCCI